MAVKAGELPHGSDPTQIAFEIGAVALGLNQSLQLRRDRAAPGKARRALARILAV